MQLRYYAIPSIGLFLTILGLVVTFGGPRPAPKQEAIAAASARDLGSIRLRDVRAESGIGFRWRLNAPNGLNLLQVVGHGCAFLDYDNDGNLDVLLVGPTPALYKGDGHGHFKDVSHETGLDKLHGHFTGCAVGDYDNDGYDDIYLSAYHGGVLLHNEGGKRFVDVTARMGIKAQPFGTSATFADLDADGRLDLFICNYVQFDLTREGDHRRLDQIPALTGVLYHNEGKRFRDVTQEWRLTRNRVGGRALGVTAADFDGSGEQKLMVANDMGANDLLVHEQGALRNLATRAGVALGDWNYRGDSHADSGMGADWGDYDNDGRLDVIVTTFRDETKNTYHNDGNGLFKNEAARLGIRQALLPYVSWGVKWVDFDNDGWLDLIVANGHLNDRAPDLDPRIETFRQPTKLLRNSGHDAFIDASDAAGPALDQRILGRGLAVGDFDNDGRMDALIVDEDGHPLLLHNETPNAGHWLTCKLIGVQSNRDGYGALLTARAGGRSLLRRCGTDGSYLSASDKRVHFGLAQATRADLSVQWPSGLREIFRNVAADRVVTLIEGSGQPLKQ